MRKVAHCRHEMGRLLAVFVLAFVPSVVRADSVSYTGTLSSSTDVVEETFTLSSPATIGLQTWGFGGGTNTAGNLIAGGGTDPFLGIFSDSGGISTILTDGLGNPYGTSADLSNYGAPNFLGCPPAGAPMIGGSPQCGDITMTLPSLSAGTYTVLLSDGQYVPVAVGDNGTLGEGFSDVTGGVFCNVVINGVNCPDPLGGAYAFDITGLPAGAPAPTPGLPPSPVPEPALGGALLGTILLGSALTIKRRNPK
jgi:hypothetical protein